MKHGGSILEHPPLTPEQVISRQVRVIRDLRGLDQQELSDRITALGGHMSRATISKIESPNLKKGISVDEALLLAMALDVSPATLFFPLDDEQPVRLAANVEVAPLTARQWLRGRGLLPIEVEGAEVDEDFFLKTVGQAERRALDAIEDAERRMGRAVAQMRAAPAGSKQAATAAKALDEASAALAKAEKAHLEVT